MTLLEQNSKRRKKKRNKRETKQGTLSKSAGIQELKSKLYLKLLYLSFSTTPLRKIPSLAFHSEESLFPPISLPFCFHLDGCLVLNCLFLVHFHQLSFIGLLFRILIHLALVGLVFFPNYF